MTFFAALWSSSRLNLLNSFNIWSTTKFGRSVGWASMGSPRNLWTTTCGPLVRYLRPSNFSSIYAHNSFSHSNNFLANASLEILRLRILREEIAMLGPEIGSDDFKGCTLLGISSSWIHLPCIVCFNLRDSTLLLPVTTSSYSTDSSFSKGMLKHPTTLVKRLT